MRTLVIVPAYNEEESIQKVINTLRGQDYEIDYVVINDCSRDNTKKILNDTAADYVSLPINLGIGGGVQCGYIYAEENDYDIAIQMDGDGQHDARYLSNLIKVLESDEADCVIGSRFIKNEGFQSSFMRRAGINFLSGQIKLCTGVKVYDVTSGFRAVNKKCIHAFSQFYAQDYPEPEAIVMLSGLGARIKEVPVIMHERGGGVSSIHSFKTIYYMIKVSLSILITHQQMKNKKRRQMLWGNK